MGFMQLKQSDCVQTYESSIMSFKGLILGLFCIRIMHVERK